MKNQEGSVLILAFLLIVALITLVGVMTYSIKSELDISRFEHNQTQAKYYAEAAAEYGSMLLMDTTKWHNTTGELLDKSDLLSNFSDIAINNITRTEITQNEKYTLDSRVNYKGVDGRVRVEYTIVADIENLNIFDYPLACGGNLNVNATVTVDGDIAANGAVNGTEKVKNADGSDKDASDIHENLGNDEDTELEIDVLDTYFAQARASAAWVISNFDAFQNNTANIVNGDCVLNISSGDIVLINGNMTLNKDFYVMGEGILIIDGNLNPNGYTFNANYDPTTNTFTDDFTIVYFEMNINPMFGHFKGMLMAHQNLNMNGASPGFDLEGSAFATKNINVNPGNFKHNDGYVDILGDIAISNGFSVVNMTKEISGWQEFY